MDILPAILNFIGTMVIAWGLLISDKRATELGVSRWAGSSDEENVKQPAIQDRIKQRKYAIIGLCFLTAGLILEVSTRFIF